MFIYFILFLEQNIQINTAGDDTQSTTDVKGQFQTRRRKSFEENIDSSQGAACEEASLGGDASHGEDEVGNCANELHLDGLQLALQGGASGVLRTVELAAFVGPHDGETNSLEDETPEPEEDGEGAEVFEVLLTAGKDAELCEESDVLRREEAKAHDGFGGGDLADERLRDSGDAVDAGGFEEVDEAGETSDCAVAVSELGEAEERLGELDVACELGKRLGGGHGKELNHSHDAITRPSLAHEFRNTSGIKFERHYFILFIFYLFVCNENLKKETLLNFFNKHEFLKLNCR